MASIRLAPTFRPARPLTRSKRVLRVTLMRTVPRSTSLSRNVLASRLTDTTVPSNCRAAAEAVRSVAAPAAVTENAVRPAARTAINAVSFMSAYLQVACSDSIARRAASGGQALG